MGNPLNVGELDTKVAELLNAELEASPLSLRQLSELSGVKKTRLGDILRRGKAMTVAELDSIAAVFNLKGWRVLRKATEALTSAPAPISSLDENVPPVSPVELDLSRWNVAAYTLDERDEEIEFP